MPVDNYRPVDIHVDNPVDMWTTCGYVDNSVDKCGTPNFPGPVRKWGGTNMDHLSPFFCSYKRNASHLLVLYLTCSIWTVILLGK